MRRHQPSFETERLRLRPFLAEDAEAVQDLAGMREIADTALSIPHPYSLDAAKAWIAGQVFSFRQSTSLHFAIELQESGELIGAIELVHIDPNPAQAELGFWVGKPWWGRGYATEAACEIIRYGFESLSLNRIYARFLSRNPRSAHLLRRLRMKKEGVLRQSARKWNVLEDVVVYAIVRDDLTAKRKPASRKRPRGDSPRRAHRRKRPPGGSPPSRAHLGCEERCCRLRPEKSRGIVTIGVSRTQSALGHPIRLTQAAATLKRHVCCAGPR